MADEMCPKCGKPLSEVQETSTGKKLQRCTGGSWDPQTKTRSGCEYVKWLAVEPQMLDEKCPKCNSPLTLVVTRFGKKLKKCSTNTWNAETKQSEGCDYVEWINGNTEELDEACPKCSKPLVLFTTNAGKKMKKCSTSGWDRENRVPTGCDYIEWLRDAKPSRAKSAPKSDDYAPPPSDDDFHG